MGYGHAKTVVYEAMELYFEPMRERRAALEADPDYVEDVLQRARAVRPLPRRSACSRTKSGGISVAMGEPLL